MAPPQWFNRLWKPWFVHRPARLIRRVLVELVPSRPGFRPLKTSWGVRVIADPTGPIGRSILTTGVYDLAVSEVLARLVAPGDTAIDAGANVGYMTLLAAVLVGAKGTVISFEPHPDLFRVIQQNVQATRRKRELATTELHNAALGDQPGMAELLLPDEFSTNDGVARVVAAPAAGARTLKVPVMTLDGVLKGRSASVLKLDVEGHEAPVLRGAGQALQERRIRHIVFEDHDVEHSEVVKLLRQAGYSMRSLGWSMAGITLQPVEAGRLAAVYEAPSYVASIALEELLARCRPEGWRVLGQRLGP